MSTLSHAQLLSAIEASQAVIDSYTTKTANERALRDKLILEALDSNTPYRTLMRLTGLSRNAIVKIGNSPAPRVNTPTIQEHA